MEYLSRPVHPVETDAFRAILTGGIISFDESMAINGW